MASPERQHVENRIFLEALAKPPRSTRRSTLRKKTAAFHRFPEGQAPSCPHEWEVLQEPAYSMFSPIEGLLFGRFPVMADRVPVAVYGATMAESEVTGKLQGGCLVAIRA